MNLNVEDAEGLVKFVNENEIEFVDFRFTDYLGKWHHVSFHNSAINEDMLEDGLLIDGSSMPGWCTINESDMQLVPDYQSAGIDPFMEKKTLYVICSLCEPLTGQPYVRDPRSVAKKAEAYLALSGVADTVYVGAEAEFFIFDGVKYAVKPEKMSFEIDNYESDSASDIDFEDGNLGHRPGLKGGYFPLSPIDNATDMRAEMLSIMANQGLPVDKHHHEVGAGQQELGFAYDTLLKTADNLQLYKHIVKNVADAYGKSATFMPKPVMGEAGSGMHTHFSLWKKNQPLFHGNGYADLSDKALYFIGGIIKHAKALNAFTNPTTNSYKRLVPGFEAPVLLAYSARNRSASCRIPHGNSPKSKRIEIRFPDPTANPYLAFAAMMMAGLDGIENKINPGEPMDKNLYDLPPEELKDVPSVAADLREALVALDEDRTFLKKGDVFTDELIDSYLEVKNAELKEFMKTPHPLEFKMYYSL
ncbi:MAG: type I glutamate--ammonia ligase [Alphaproteobacteria bacterium]|nr:type I glutamate--ammonia ligase [Alphaproteobacteria bacterium]